MFKKYWGAVAPLAPMFRRPSNILFLNTSKCKFLLNISGFMPLSKRMVSYNYIILPLFDYGDIDQNCVWFTSKNFSNQGT